MGKQKNIVVTGADGFMGKSLCLRLSDLGRFEVIPLMRGSSQEEWRAALSRADAAIHLAGVNRPKDEAEFEGNPASVKALIDAMTAAGSFVPVVLASSAKAADDTAYGRSKREAEELLSSAGEKLRAPVAIYRLPNVFGKWCKPNYNSAVATFCHNLARDLPISINDPAAALELVYVDDVISEFIAKIEDGFESGFHDVRPVYRTTVGEVADLIAAFRAGRPEGKVENVGVGLPRALYATYVSYLPALDFAYPIASHRDPRGAFSEMLKTPEAGQFSYFTAFPGVTRGGHYHHTKTEKFLVVQGLARFRFRHMLTGEVHEITTSGDAPCVVETIPGWTHDITNVGEETLISILWANEVFDREKPDTIAEPV